MIEILEELQDKVSCMMINDEGDQCLVDQHKYLRRESEWTIERECA